MLIQSVRIETFKSVVDLSLDLGRFNVLIGENGCGKSNILESISVAAAANSDKLDHEFLSSRGIRVTSPELMFSAFKPQTEKARIEVVSMNGEDPLVIDIRADKENSKALTHELTNEFFRAYISTALSRIWAFIRDEDEKELPPVDDNSEIAIFIRELAKPLTMPPDVAGFLENARKKYLYHPTLPHFVTYTPEQSSLRKFEEAGQILPLGVKGEGLFQHLKEMVQDHKKYGKVLKEIQTSLSLLDWYEDFKIPKGLMQNEFSLQIKDRYLSEHLQYFDQRSTNEGFLFLLFYITLFSSPDTPSFFAVDNIDTSFNPKLCKEVIRVLVKLAKKSSKQVIVTTHNPAVLDGLNLKDDEQRLFVVRRNDEGHTRATRIEHKAERTMHLSELWTNGYIGGLPENF